MSLNERRMRAHQAMGPGLEFDTIRLLMERWGDLAADIGDDAAVLSWAGDECRAGRQLVVSTDACLDGTHFREAWLGPDEVGARAIAAALSDLAAMGARAESVLLAFTVPDMWRERLAGVADGIARVLRPTGARIVGGNMSHGAAFGITTTVIGSVATPVSRRGAQPGDRLLVTGLLGGPGQAVAAWYGGQEPSDWARGRFVAPVPRLAAGERLAACGAHAMLDISDGLAADARHLAAASGVHLRLDVARLPVGPGIVRADALRSGEEYELLVAAPAHVADAILRDWDVDVLSPLTDIGEVLAAYDGGLVDIIGLPNVTDTRARVEFVGGHDHFTR